MAVIIQYILIGNILTTKWYKSLYSPFNQQLRLWFSYNRERKFCRQSSLSRNTTSCHQFLLDQRI